MMEEMRIPPVHPGEVLLEDFLKQLGMSQYRLAKAIKVYPRKINEIVLKKRSITADTALRLSRFFGNSARFWMGLQIDYDLDVAKALLWGRIQQQIIPLVNEDTPPYGELEDEE